MENHFTLKQINCDTNVFQCAIKKRKAKKKKTFFFLSPESEFNNQNQESGYSN